jgi:hypothetical protein
MWVGISYFGGGEMGIVDLFDVVILTGLLWIGKI